MMSPTCHGFKWTGRIGSAFAAAGLAACLAGCLFQSDDPSRLAGTGSQGGNAIVVGAVYLPDGRPAAGAKVSLRRSDYLAYPSGILPGQADGGSGTTDKDGGFRFQGLAHGEYALEIRSGDQGLRLTCEVASDTGMFRIPRDTLSKTGSVSGRLVGVPAGLAGSFVQVYGLERLVPVDAATGKYLVSDLPRGAQTLRAYVPAAGTWVGETGVRIVSGNPADSADIAMLPGSGLVFGSRDGGLSIQGVGPDNPIIYDNNDFDGGLDDEYMWARAGLGANLVGIIASRDMTWYDETDTTYFSNLQDIYDQAVRSVATARNSGIGRLPDPVKGPNLRLVVPASLNLDEFTPEDNPGSRLIIAEAKKASPEKPLLVIAEGQPISAANALLLDSSIADRIIVFSYEYGRASKPYDAFYVAKKTRFVNCDLRWNGEFPVASFSLLPANPLGDSLRARRNRPQPNAKSGSSSAVFFLFHASTWRGAVPMLLSAPGSYGPGTASRLDFIHIPGDAVDKRVQADDFFSTLTNPDVYKSGPKP